MRRIWKAACWGKEEHIILSNGCWNAYLTYIDVEQDTLNAKRELRLRGIDARYG